LVLFVREDDSSGSETPGIAATTAREWFEQGLRLMASARTSEASDAFKKSLALNPGHPAAMVNLGYCLFDLGSFEEAVEIFTTAFEASSVNFDALYGLALAQQRLGNRDEAIILWRRYLREAPESVWKERARERLRLLTGRSD
jgi:tetratricopeptide (TPR) repeat protein